MATSTIRVLLVDDYEPWRRFFLTTLQERSELQIIGEASDGLEGVQQAELLCPDLILLDIGLPSLSGIEAARRIREVSPASKILFVSENRSIDIVKEALSTGAGGYVLKSNAANELLSAIEAILEDRLFVSASLGSHGLSSSPDLQAGARFHGENVARLMPTQSATSICQHEVGFYYDDRRLLDDLTQFVGATLLAGNSIIVAATESHRASLLARLQADGINARAAIEQGRYIALDAAEILSAFMVHDLPDPIRFLELLGDLIVSAREAVAGQHSRVSVFGECVSLLWAQGNAEAAIQLEKLGNKLTKIHDVDIFCGYHLGGVEGGMDAHVYERICAEHSGVHSD